MGGGGKRAGQGESLLPFDSPAAAAAAGPRPGWSSSPLSPLPDGRSTPRRHLSRSGCLWRLCVCACVSVRGGGGSACVREGWMASKEVVTMDGILSSDLMLHATTNARPNGNGRAPRHHDRRSIHPATKGGGDRATSVVAGVCGDGGCDASVHRSNCSVCDGMARAAAGRGQKPSTQHKKPRERSQAASSYYARRTTEARCSHIPSKQASKHITRPTRRSIDRSEHADRVLKNAKKYLRSPSCLLLQTHTSSFKYCICI